MVSNKSTHQWSPHSPDLNPPDFFLWGYLKDVVYVNRPQTIQELKNNITHEISQIPREMRESVMKNFQKRLEVCLDVMRGTCNTSSSRKKTRYDIVDILYC